MEKKELDKENEPKGLLAIWVSLVVKNPRAAIAIGCTIIIIAEFWIARTLYKDRNETYQALIEYKDACSQEKLNIIYGAIQKQEAFNAKYEEKIDILYDRLNDINRELKTKK